MAPNPQGRMPGLCDYRHGFSTLSLVECALDIDVRRWQRRNLLVADTTFQCLWSTNDAKAASLKVRVVSKELVRLLYRVRMPQKRWEQLDKPVSVVWTGCRYGGQRPWFLCPECLRRAAVLYLGGASPLSFSCRLCAKLKYDSQRNGPRLRMLRKAEEIRRQLGGSGSLDESFPDRPSNMREKKYQRIKMLATCAEEKWRRRSEYLLRWFESAARQTDSLRPSPLKAQSDSDMNRIHGKANIQ